MRDALVGPEPPSSSPIGDRRAGTTEGRTRGLLRPLLLLRRSLLLSRRRGACTSPACACPEPLSTNRRRPSNTRIAAAAREQQQSAATPAAAAAADANATPLPLDDQHLARYLSNHCPEASLVPRDSLTEEQERDHVVKSIVLSAKGFGPVLAVARLSDRLDERSVASHLGLSRRSVRLATTAEALEWSGFVVGTVPPVGHRSPLRTLVDVGVTRAGCSNDAAVFGGGGREGVEMRIPLAALLRASCAEVGEFVKLGGGGNTSVSVSSSSDEEDGPRSRGNNSKAGALPPPLPLPWPPGSDVVRLVATVSSRRRVARLLMFATLAPEQGSEAGRRPGGNNNNHSGSPPRPRPWARPGGSPDEAVEVQVIAGKTLERALGVEQLAQLLSSVRPGCVVAVTGRLQQQQPPGRQGDDGEVSGAAPSPSKTALDVVACELEVLFASTAERGAALRAAEAKAGLEPRSLRSARDLLALRRAVAADGGSATAAAAAAAAAAAVGFAALQDEPSAPNPPPAASLSPNSTNDDDDEDDDDERADADGVPHYRLPFPPEDPSSVLFVDDLAGVEACAAALRAAEDQQRRRWEQDEKNPGADDPPPSLSSRFLLSGRAAVVGIDAEWAPFGSSNGGDGAASASESDGPTSTSSSSPSRARSPVALLQLALRDRVFLLDLPALIGGGARGNDDDDDDDDDPQRQPLSQAELAVDALLSRLLASPWLVKCGFGLQHDLRRMADSYPRLPLFAPEAVTFVPIASHVDLPLLARAVLPQLAYKAPASFSAKPLGPVPSLSRLCEAALGLKLDKRQQRSAWERRPLSKAQVRYAAADAHVLTAVFDSLVGRAAFLGERGERGEGGGDVGAAARALDGGLRRVPRAKPPTTAPTTTTTINRRR